MRDFNGEAFSRLLGEWGNPITLGRMPHPSTIRSGRFWILALVLFLGAVAGWLAFQIGPGLRFVASLQKAEVAEGPASFTVQDRWVDVAGRRVALRLYRPTGRIQRILLLAHGVHDSGYDEPRLVRCAREMARQGMLVATPDLVDLKAYDLTPRTIDELEAVGLFLLKEPSLGPAPRRRALAFCGISFSGGLCLSAAARPSLRGRLGCVFSLGGHADLEHVIRYLSTGTLPDGRQRAPHLYGQAVLLRRFAEHLVPPGQVEALRASLMLFLQERNRAFAASVSGLPPESRRIAEFCLHWDARGACAALGPVTRGFRCDPRLSPVLGAVPDCPVFLLHGVSDNVIPPSENEALARWAGGATPTCALVSGLVRHVDLEGKASRWGSLLETYRLGRFMTQLLRS